MFIQTFSSVVLLASAHLVSSQTNNICGSLPNAGGWDGVASISYYAYMGTACDCGHDSEAAANWQGNTGAALNIGQGFYSGAVNNVIFQGNLNGQGDPGCGKACGVCYELQTTGVNAYGGGPGNGSSIVVMVVDACYNTNGAPNWCSSNTDVGVDDFGCGVHFDIDTDPTLNDPNPPFPVGQDGTVWANGGEFVQYRRTSCPPAMAAAFASDCAGDC